MPKRIYNPDRDKAPTKKNNPPKPVKQTSKKQTTKKSPSKKRYNQSEQ